MRRLTKDDPKELGEYRLQGRIGEGGMGVVYAGARAGGGRVALKVVHDGMAADPEFRARFRREVALVSRLHSPFLPLFHGADPDAARPWLATSLEPGPTLAQYLRAVGPLSTDMVVALAAGVAEALRAIHAAGVVHRDLKPGNVILSVNGPKVLDLGIARAVEDEDLTATGMLVGTPGWISPEQFHGHPATPASDLYAWAHLVVFAATGRSPLAVTASHNQVTAYTSEMPPILVPLVTSALSADPARRPTAEDVLCMIHGLGGDPTPASTVRLTERVWTPPPRSANRNRRPHGRILALAAAMAAVILVCGGLGLFVLIPDRPGQAALEESTQDDIGSDETVRTVPNAYEEGEAWPWGLATDSAESDGWSSRVEITQVDAELAALLSDREEGEEYAHFEQSDARGNAVTLALFDAMATPNGVEFGGYLLAEGDEPPTVTSSSLSAHGPEGWAPPLHALEVAPRASEAVLLRFALDGHRVWDGGNPSVAGFQPYQLVTFQGSDYQEEGTGPPPVSVCYVPGERIPSDDYWVPRYGPGEGFSTDFGNCL
ncbi:serine/threonine-protein kinase [Nocardiopsis alba]|uniref:serine/threonine-protein kinase n=1 Tax=Nocardiopsis alba TaxID=53437 RepID=UPI0033C43138